MLFVDQGELILANLLGSKLFGRPVEMPGEPIDVIGVGINGPRREIADLHVFGHTSGQRRQTFAVRSHGTGSLRAEIEKEPAMTPHVHRYYPSMIAHAKSASPFYRNVPHNRTGSDGAKKVGTAAREAV